MVLAKTRRNVVDFTEYLAHAEVSYKANSTNIIRIRSHFEHNQRCRDAGLAQDPNRSLHLSILSIALDRLKDGATPDAIQTPNRELYKARGYPWQPYDLTLAIPLAAKGR
jgi:hypothetical protein